MELKTVVIGSLSFGHGRLGCFSEMGVSRKVFLCNDLRKFWM